MIVQRFVISRYDWKVVVLYEVDSSNTDDVINILSEICDNERIIKRAAHNVSAGHKNTGFIYSDFDERRSLIVIGKASSAQELIDTIVHEANHLQSHIATVFNLDEKGEAVSYLIGGIAKTMYRSFKKLICS